MSYLQNQMNILKYDKRLLELNVKSGIITEAEYNQYVANLKDDKGNAIQLDLAAEAESRRESSMNGGSHHGEKRETPAMPTNNDPFGSGF